MGRGYGPSTARRSCRVGPYTIKWVVTRPGSPVTAHLAIYTSSHDNDGSRHTRPILLLFSLRLCLHFRAIPFSAEGVGAGASSSYLSDTNPDTDLHSGYSTSMRMFHIMCVPLFSPSSDVPLVFSAFALFFLPNLLPPPTSQPRTDRYSSTWVRGESVMLLSSIGLFVSGFFNYLF